MQLLGQYPVGQSPHYFMEATEATEAQVIAIEEKVTNAEKLLSEAEIHASEAKEFHEQKKHVDALWKDVVHLAIKLGEVGSSLADMY